MAKARKTKQSTSGRGSAQAIEKRRVARQLNAILNEGGSPKPKLDGRTEKRRQRLIKELKQGKGGKELKPHDVLQHTHELLEIGETIASLRKQGIKPRKVELSKDVLNVIKRHAQAFSFNPDAWRMLSLRVDEQGGVVARGTTGSKTKSPSKKRRTTRKK